MNISNMKNDLSKVGNRIKQARKSRGISQVELAGKLDISVSHLSNIENGKSTVGLDIFIDIIDALNISADWLLDNENDSSKRISEQAMQLFADCTESEIQTLLNVAREVKNSLRNQK